MSGYSVRREALYREARTYELFAGNVEQVRADLRAAFNRDRNTLGDDEYGAELAKKLPEMERGIFDVLTKYIDELEDVAMGLSTSARNYKAAEHPPPATRN
ncbi:hypothetical protein ACFFV7_44865 [Nonomuraea spiralis]|uniref:Uncharacterized protein n=1 Tax=Nonomuraea spiralis TaxID=46182 RepID=A0ABV5IV16_9ACTN|nr:hypothetical protein [Nonomuraea spiralis]GGS82121.1 hypothetical protein GCM10010176_026900 [Nonomuraea spiralis]